MRKLLCVVLAALPVTALAADPCDPPKPRDTAPLAKAVVEDDQMASAFDATATACATVSAACDAEVPKCQSLLTATLQKQVGLDDGLWLRDMLLPFQGQRYALTAGIPTQTTNNDVSCNADGASLKAAAARRKMLAQKRRDIMNEYPKWVGWSAQLSQKCKTDAALNKQQQEAAAASAATAAAAAAAAAAAEGKKQEEVKKAQDAAAAKMEAERKAKEDALRQQEEAKKRQAEQLKDQQKQKELAEEKAKQDAIDKQNAQVVAQREGAKDAAEKKAIELEAAEATRRAAAQKAIDEARMVDRSDERLKGSVAALLHTYWTSDPSGGSLLLGGLISARYGWWRVAPAQGMASGFEVKANVGVHGEIVGNQGVNLLSVMPEMRYYFGHFGVGAAFEWRRLFGSITSVLSAPDDFALGPVLSFAALDSPTARLVFTARWMPIFSWDAARFTGEAEFAYEWFYCSIQGGTLRKPGTGTMENPFQLQWYLGGGLGARIRF